jgi:hypothetical protein
MDWPRRGAASCILHYRLYTAGGKSEEAPRSSVVCESLDPWGIEWRREADLPSPRYV